MDPKMILSAVQNQRQNMNNHFYVKAFQIIFSALKKKLRTIYFRFNVTFKNDSLIESKPRLSFLFDQRKFKTVSWLGTSFLLAVKQKCDIYG